MYNYHHSPGTGCPGCRKHFCYKCLKSDDDNRRERRSENNCLCGSWSTQCESANILENITMDGGYPRDKRCGCPICNECKYQSGCPNCDGNCVVCQGIVNKGPTEIDPTWEPRSTILMEKELQLKL